MVRPQPPYPAPPGYQWQPASQGAEWRTQGGLLDLAQHGKCRYTTGPGHKLCGRPAVAALNRGYTDSGGRRDQWWAYCEQHLYSRWIEDGQILGWRLMEVVRDA